MRSSLLGLLLGLSGCQAPATPIVPPATSHSAEPRAFATRFRELMTHLSKAMKERGDLLDEVPYPFRVNTDSGCGVRIQNRQDFLRHYGQIVDDRIADAILRWDDDPPRLSGPPPYGLRDGVFWVAEESAGKLTVVFNPRTSRIEGLPCEDEMPLRSDVSLVGTWVPDSVCQVENRRIAPSGILTVTIDADFKSVVIVNRDGAKTSCTIDRYSEVTVDKFPTNEYRCGVVELSEGPLLTLHCGAQWGRLYVSHRMMIESGSSQWIRLVPSTLAEASGKATVAEGDACGSGRACAANLVCDAQLAEDELKERCRKIGDEVSP